MLASPAKTSLPRQIRDDLATQIRTGVLRAGAPLPSFSELCTHYRASRFSVNAAMRMLEADKLIHPRRRRPALVRKLAPVSSLKRIALVLPFPVEDFHYNSSPQAWMFYHTLLSAVMSRGCQCVTLRTDCWEQSRAASVDAALLFSLPVQKVVLPRGIPLVHLRSAYDGSAANTVYLRRHNGMLQSALYFLGHGVKSILQWGISTVFNEELNSSFRTPLTERGIAPEAITTYEFRNIIDMETARESVREYLATSPELPIGIITGGDFTASGAVQACLDAGLRIKEDFFVIGFTDLPETARWRPALTVQSVPYQELAESALNMLELLIGSGCDQPPEFIDNKLIIRET